MKILLVSLCSLAFSLALTPTVRALALARGKRFVAQPRNDRWHRKPTALLGGLAIYLAYTLACLLFAEDVQGMHMIWAAGTMLCLVGLVDDLINIKPYAKFGIQLIVASVVVYFGRQLPWTDQEAVNIFLTIFWLVGITNAINLLDNMDGLASGITLIACVFMAITFVLNGQVEQALLPAALGGAALGFLVYNFNPATIFMGDCGSMFLGFSLGTMALFSQYDRTRNVGAVLLTPVFILLIPIFDTCVVTVTRKLAGRPISQGGRDHTSHRLVALGISERRAVWILYALAAGSGLLAILIRDLHWQQLLWLIPTTGLIVLFIGVYLSKVHVYESREQAQAEGLPLLNVLAEFTYKRRIFEILLDAILVFLAYYGAFLLRFDGDIPPEYARMSLNTLPLIVALQMSLFLFYGLYRGLWRYLGVSDLVTIGKAVGVGAMLCAFAMSALYVLELPAALVFRVGAHPPWTVFVLYALLLLFFIGVSRLSFHVLRSLFVGGGGDQSSLPSDAKPVLIYGAGDRGELLVRELLNNPDCRYAPLGFIDDDIRKAGKLLNGRRIFNTGELAQLAERLEIREVLVSSVKVSDNKLDYIRSLGIEVARMSIRIESERGEVRLQPASNF